MLIAGKLYKYNKARKVYVDLAGSQTVDDVEQDQPFVFLEVNVLKWVEAYKVLTINGVVGWIHVGYPEDIEPVGENYVELQSIQE